MGSLQGHDIKRVEDLSVQEFDHQVMDMLKEHAKNNDRESRVVMPDLNSY